MRAARKYNTTFVPKSFRKRDLVLTCQLKDKTTNKLIPNWEGPFYVHNEADKGVIKLEQGSKFCEHGTQNKSQVQRSVYGPSGKLSPKCEGRLTIPQENCVLCEVWFYKPPGKISHAWEDHLYDPLGKQSSKCEGWLYDTRQIILCSKAGSMTSRHKVSSGKVGQ
ncbi:hypothetical protein CR513_33178, partial [Mucuna pruriens]